MDTAPAFFETGAEVNDLLEVKRVTNLVLPSIEDLYLAAISDNLEIFSLVSGILDNFAIISSKVSIRSDSFEFNWFNLLMSVK